MRQKKEKRAEAFVFFGFLLFSFVLMYFCTASSPRYATNPWTDANAFFTVGKAMANGLTIYKDIFEQKGPLLYFLHAVAYRISHTSFTGVYVLESAAVSVFLFYSYKLCALYLRRLPSAAAAIVSAAIAVNSVAFYYGDSPEEFVLPFLAVSLYHAARYFRSPEEKNALLPLLFLNGLFAGCIAMIKFTLLGFWFGWMAMIALHTLFVKKEIKAAFLKSAVFVSGMLAAAAPWLIYFALRGALRDFINVYFVINTTAYTVSQTGWIAKLCRMVFIYFSNVRSSPELLFPTLAGVILSFFTPNLTERKRFSRLWVPAVAFFGLVSVYIGGRFYNYYFLVFAAFLPFFFITIGLPIRRHVEKKVNGSHVVGAAVLTAVIAASVFGSAFYGISAMSLERDPEKTPQYRFHEYMCQTKADGVILCFNTLDNGCYLPGDTVPAFKYFEAQNIPAEKYPDIDTAQKRYVQNGEPDFIISFGLNDRPDDFYTACPALKENYRLVKTGQQQIARTVFGRKTTVFHYYLFEKRG